MHVFSGRSGSGVELHVYSDHIEVHSAGGKEVLALWYRHIRTLVSSREDGTEALAIVDRGGQVLLVPLADGQVSAAHWLISSVMEWAGRS